MEHLYRTAKYLVVLIFLYPIGCTDSDDNAGFEEPDLYQIGEFQEDNLTIIAYSGQPLEMGFNRIYFDVLRDGDRTNDYTVDFFPMMHMENHSHSAPFDPAGTTRDGNSDLYEGWAIFIMPSGMMGSWELQVTLIDNSENTIAEDVIEIEVDETGLVQTFMDEDENRFVLTLVEPMNPETGMNDLIVALHQRETMMSFPPVTDAVMDFEPWMPSMDHGSSNNENPVHETGGFYFGQVNFNMTGDWELRFWINRDGNEIGYQTFELDF